MSKKQSSQKNTSKTVPNKKEQVNDNKIVIGAIIAIIVIIGIIAAIMMISNNKTNNIPNNDTNNNNVVDNVEKTVDKTTEQIKETVQKLSCEEKAKQLTPNTMKLTKNSLDPMWSFNNKNNTNEWSDGKLMTSLRFIRFILSEGNVYKAEKPLIKEPHYFVYDGTDIYFEISPSLKEITDSLDIKQGYGGQMFYTQEFSVQDIGLIQCVLRNQ